MPVCLSQACLTLYWSVVPTAKSLYSVHPGVVMTQKWVAT